MENKNTTQFQFENLTINIEDVTQKWEKKLGGPS